jgi:hypothetical protein
MDFFLFSQLGRQAASLPAAHGWDKQQTSFTALQCLLLMHQSTIVKDKRYMILLTPLLGKLHLTYYFTCSFIPYIISMTSLNYT